MSRPLFEARVHLLFAGFEPTQQTFQRRFNVVFGLIWRRHVAQRQINVETILCFSTLNWTTLDNVKTTLSFSTSIFTTLGNVETTLQIWPFEKKYKHRFKNKIIFSNFKEYVGLNIFLHFFPILTLFWRRPLSYRNQSIDLLYRSVDWFYMITASVMKELNIT